MDEEYKDAFNHQRNSQNKFDYFFLGVILAALSLSIQSYDSTKELNHSFLIICSWIFFLFSFLSGFFRQERLNLSYMIEAERIPQYKRKTMLERADKQEIILQNNAYEEWSESKIHENLENATAILNISETYLDKHHKHAVFAYQIQKWSFFYASFFYILFKISNATKISFTLLILLILIGVIINISSVLIFKYLLRK